MNDTQGNGFVLTAENSLDRDIVKVRKEGGFSGTTLVASGASLPLPGGSTTCKLTNIDN